MEEKRENTYILEPYFKAFEESIGCRVTLHDYVNFLFSEGRPLFDSFLRCSHRRTFPEQCGKEFRPYCIRHCMDEFNKRLEKKPCDCCFKHCRKHYWEVAVPVYRNGSCILVFFAGLFDPRTEREKMRRARLLLSFFVSGVCGIAENIREKEFFGNSLEKKIVSFVKENFNRPVSTRDLADHLSLSVTRVCHLVRVHCGKTFFELMTEERLRHAGLFLKQSDFRIKEISALCGFQNPEHFNRVFRSATGMTPGQFRQSEETDGR